MLNTGQIIMLFAAMLVPMGVAAYYFGWAKALALNSGGRITHSRPRQYGWYVVVWMLLPAIVIGGLASAVQLLGIYVPPGPAVLAVALVAAAGGLALSLRSIEPPLRARAFLERVIRYLLFAASLVSILTTAAIVLSVLFESIRFFSQVSLWNFVTGTEWDPDTAFISSAGRGGEVVAEAKFGSVPLFAGTLLISAIAMSVAVPIGLFSAIYMAEYATPRIRAAAKPMLEVLAGIPTVVYGFFAAITVSPMVVWVAELVGLEASYTNALAPGLVMGIMIIPFISSLSDDVINSVPNSLREGAYALGTTKSEAIKQIILPAAFPGIMAAFILGVSRALGETMIVVMAAGLRPNLTLNPLEDMTTVTVRIVDAFTGDQAFDSLETLSAFALGLVLFVVTLTLNVLSIMLVRHFREKYKYD